ncbi:MAG TPA: hypothetical protein VNL35_10240 [Chloroflexota bacterium]|nr:hypothetical protein [Chloroflexota bacterium]
MKKTRRILAILGLVGMAVISSGAISQSQMTHNQATTIQPGPLSSSSTPSVG